MNLVDIAQQTVEITKVGHYKAPSGATRHLKPIVPSEEFPASIVGFVKSDVFQMTVTEVTKESTLEAIKRLGPGTVALNFASATRPGGGFLHGAVAQEESLARSSTLYATLVGKSYYAEHLNVSGLYTDHMIYSPGVEIFRDDNGQLLEESYEAAFITSPAVNQHYLKEFERQLVPTIMRQRAAKVLGIAASKLHSKIVLGAWGCGVFGNDPELVAGIFKNLLTNEYRGAFSNVVFAIYKGGPSYSAFQRAFPA